MLHHIFRNLWNSRKRNVWILLELIVIAIVCWMVIDPLFVIFYNKSIPDGYEADGLYRLQLSVVPSDEEIRPEDFRKLMERLRSHEQIESATYVVNNHYPCSRGNSFNNLTLDTMSVRVAFMDFCSAHRFLSNLANTFGQRRYLGKPRKCRIYGE